MNVTGKLSPKTLILWLILYAIYGSCDLSVRKEPRSGTRSDRRVVVKKRADGTLSSINQVDELNRVHGVRVTYYADGKTIYSKTTFEHGIKNGSFEKYYRNGQAFKHATFKNGKEDGLTTKFYMNGNLMAEVMSEEGLVLPGLKEFKRDGDLITEYPEIKFRKIDQLKERNKIELQVFSEPSGYPVKYFLTEPGTGHKERVYLISDRGNASLQFYVKPGETLEEEVEITAEISTKLGNTLVRYLTYTLSVRN